MVDLDSEPRASNEPKPLLALTPASVRQQIQSLSTDGVTAAELLRTLVALRMVRDDVTDASFARDLAELAALVHRGLGRQRLDHVRREARRETAVDPVRTRIIFQLGLRWLVPEVADRRNDFTPSALASDLGVALATVSRELASLRGEGIAEETADPDDGRRKFYTLTAAGYESFLGLFGFVDTGAAAPPMPDLPVAWRLLSKRLDAAVAERRCEGDLRDAEVEISSIVDAADRAGLGRLAVRARAELAKTCWQLSDEDGFARAVEDLGTIAAGEARGVDPRSVQPAIAARAYVLGRAPEYLGPRAGEAELELLSVAEQGFADLSRRPHAELDDTAAWRDYRTMAALARADVYRGRTLHGEAVRFARQAYDWASEAEDLWGQAKALYVAGASMRLRGEFDPAANALGAALKLSRMKGYSRLEVEVLAQLGDVMRLQKDYAAAADLLGDAYERACHLELAKALAFIESALGAVAYEGDDLTNAVRHLRAASDRCRVLGDADGEALAFRRWAIVGRCQEESERSVRKMILRSLQRYLSLRSPAGVAASLVDWVSLRRAAGRDDRGAESVLTDWLCNPDRMKLVQIDPWVPAMLARVTEDDPESSLSRLVNGLGLTHTSPPQASPLAAFEALQERAPALLDRGPTADLVPDRLPPSNVDEMAGEPRRLVLDEPSEPWPVAA